ncbi:MAG: glutaminyl-peptide cyclotransferase [Pseudonocardia sp.]|nr:glutaminyl-peptide cyclotransferase [Pseudonocardia sp.]
MTGRRSLRAAAAVLLVAAGLTACGTAPDPAGSVPAPRPVVLAEIAHDPSAFTQGLELDGGILYEGTGLEGRSQLRELDPATGTLRRSVPLPSGYFGEGITVVGDRIWQLTWRDGVALEWDRASLRLLREVPMDGEGWGLCGLDNRLVRSDGTSTLRFHDPATFAETGSVEVTLDGDPVPDLNELECVGGRGAAAGGAGGVGTAQVWANVWQTDRLVRIDPDTGRVTAVVDASGLLTPQQSAGADVLNGIAHVRDDEYLLTGKLWPVMFRVRLPT